MLKVTGPKNSYWPKQIYLKQHYCFAIPRITSRRKRVWPLFILSLDVYFNAFSQYSVWQTILLQESFENRTPSVEAAGAAGGVLRTTGDAAVLQLVILENTTGEPDLTV